MDEVRGRDRGVEGRVVQEGRKEEDAGQGGVKGRGLEEGGRDIGDVHARVGGPGEVDLPGRVDAKGGGESGPEGEELCSNVKFVLSCRSPG